MDEPKKLLGNETPPTRPLSAALSLFDINILPPRYRRRKIRFVAILPWLAFLLLLGALYPTGINAMQVQSELKGKQKELDEMQLLFDTSQSAADDQVALQEEIDQKIEQRDLIISSYEGLDLQGSNWSAFLDQIEKNTPDGINWAVIDQVENEIYMNGVAESYDAVLDLKDTLEQIDQFLNLEIISINQIIEELPQSDPETEGEEATPFTRITTFEFSLSGLISEEGLR